MDSFYYTLQSNASLDCYPSNTCTNFKVRLLQRMNLHGEWVVGLAEIHFPIKFLPRGEKRKNEEAEEEEPPEKRKKDEEESPDVVPQAVVSGVVDLRSKRSISLSEPPVIYHGEGIGPKLPPDNRDQTILTLNKKVQELAENIKKMQLNLKDVTNTTGEEILQLKQMSDCWQHNYVSMSKLIHQDVNHLNAKMNAPKYLYVYCSVAELELVGDRYGPFLRVVRIPPLQMTGETKDKDWVNPHYKKVSTRDCDTLEVDIRDEKGRPVSFAKGVVIVTLHFKKVR
jgi:hypothetical protein